MNRYVITAFVPDPLGKQLAELRQQHDTFSRQWLPPHVTIVPPFDLSIGEDVAGAISRFQLNVPVKLGGWGWFERKYSSVLYLQAISPELERAKDRLRTEVPRVAPFVRLDEPFHVTVVSRVPNEQFAAVRETVTKDTPRGTFRIEQLRLYRWHDVEHQWQLVEIDELDDQTSD